MEALALLARAVSCGLHFRIDGTEIVLRGPESAEDLAHEILEAKVGLIPILENPGKAARGAWSAALEEVSLTWNQLASGDREAPWLDPALDDRLQATVGKAIRNTKDADSLAQALEAIEAWKRAWMRLLDAPPPLEPTVPPSLIDRAKGLDGKKLFALVHDPQVPEVERAAYQDEILARADAMIKEAEGRCPPPYPSVHAMFDKARARLGSRDLEERSITAWLKKNAPEVAARWPEAPIDASWFDWRVKVDGEAVAQLDLAFNVLNEKSSGSILKGVEDETQPV